MTTTNENTATEYTGEATYCPEDNKLRLYVGRVPRAEYEALRAQGWTSTSKQDCDFVATWTPARRDMALSYAGFIGDEDQSPAERAADRAERFAGYRDKRTTEATNHADRFDSRPSVHGYQSQAKAERATARHDRIADRACDSWSKAEYWTHRTAGVILHALHRSTPAVRMGRLKTLEAEQRKLLSGLEEAAKRYELWRKISQMTDPEKQTAAAIRFAGGNGCHFYGYKHPRPDSVTNSHIKANGSSLYTLLTMEADPITGAEACALYFARHVDPQSPQWNETPSAEWQRHLMMRLGYENQMLEAEGGRAGFLEMVPGGWIGSRQIRRVNKSNVSGRVVSVEVMGTFRGFTKESGYKIEETKPCPVNIEVERLPADSYRPPTPEDIETLNATLAAEKAARPKVDACPLVNPTDEDAERLVALWNEKRRQTHEERNSYKSPEARASHSALFKPCEIQRITQAVYSAASKGSYARAETRELCSLGRLKERNVFYDYSGQAERAAERGPAVCKIRATGFDPVHVIIITDKPQKPLPEAVWEKYNPTPKVETLPAPTPEAVATFQGDLF